MRDRILSAITVAAITGAATCMAQTHKVAPTPETVVRAVGVYEWTGSLAKPTGIRFMPVTVFINGDLEDAGNYKPQPVPFALLSGNIYELEDAGLSKGTVVLESALHAKLPDGAPGPAFDDGWTAYGSYKPPATEKKSAPLKPSKNLPVIQTAGGDPNRPHLTNKSGDAAGKSTDAGQTQQQGTKPDSSTASNNNPDSDPDRPTMHRRTTSDDTSSNTAGSAGSSGTDSNDPAERPTLKRRSPEEEKKAKDQKKKNDVATVTAGGSLDDPDRPRLHHGGGKSEEDNEFPKLMGVPKDMHQMVAVSDAKSRDPHPFARPWEDTNERTAILAKMQAFAHAKLAEYGTVPGVTPASAVAGTATGASATSPATSTAPDTGPPTLKRGIPSKASVTTENTTPTPTPAAKASTPKTSPPAPSSSSRKSTASHTSARSHRNAAKTPAAVTLADEDLKGYTLSYGGAATYVYQAHTVETGSVMRYVTVVAQDDAMGGLKLALASVTDAAHLDRTPWMRLIDAVDVEASNRASLLFELRGQSSRQFGLYRVIAAKPEQIFVTGSTM